MARRAHRNLLLSQRSMDGRNKIVKILQMGGTQKPFAFSKLDMSKSHRRQAEHTEIFCFLEHRFNNILQAHVILAFSNTDSTIFLQAHVLRASNRALCRVEEEDRSIERWENRRSRLHTYSNFNVSIHTIKKQI